MVTNPNKSTALQGVQIAQKSNSNREFVVWGRLLDDLKQQKRQDNNRKPVHTIQRSNQGGVSISSSPNPFIPSYVIAKRKKAP